MERLTIGEVLKPQGIRGELKIKTFTDFPEDVKAFGTVYIDEKPYKILSFRAGEGGVCLSGAARRARPQRGGAFARQKDRGGQGGRAGAGGGQILYRRSFGRGGGDGKRGAAGYGQGYRAALLRSLYAGKGRKANFVSRGKGRSEARGDSGKAADRGQKTFRRSGGVLKGALKIPRTDLCRTGDFPKRRSKVGCDFLSKPIFKTPSENQSLFFRPKQFSKLPPENQLLFSV